MKSCFISIVLIFLFQSSGICQQQEQIRINDAIIKIGSPVIADSLDKELPSSYRTTINKVNTTTYHVQIAITPGQPNDAVCVDVGLDIPVRNKQEIDNAKHAFHWVPNIKNGPGQIISQHVFRSPCIILTLKKNAVIFVPDLHEMKNKSAAPYYFDLNYLSDRIRINFGMSNYDVIKHQYYQKNKRSFPVKEKLNLSFYVLVSRGTDPLESLRMTNEFLWTEFAGEYTASRLPQTVSFRQYADTGYSMAIKNYWVNAGDEKGGITLSTFFDKKEKVYRGRFYKNDLWYHSWFNNMRTAYGLYHWGKEMKMDDWKQKALASAKLLLDAPTNKGWFPTVFATEQNKWVESGQGGKAGLYHMPDNAWTAFWLLRFNDELQTIAGVDQFALNFSRALLKAQNSNGSFPARVDAVTLAADPVLQSSASSAMATWFLLEMILRNKVPTAETPAYRQAVIRSLEFLKREVLPQQRFEDFELYFSCSAKPMHYYDSLTCMYGQNTLAIQWCAEAYLKAFQVFNNKQYLAEGEYCLNILSLYQQVWNPPYINLYAFGGFGVMNTDAEWNDARQAQFSETYLNYYLLTNKKEYRERAIFACRASFALMVIPENKDVCPDNFRGTDFNGESFSGTMAENYGHDGYNSRSYQSGFHWGTGSALTSAAILTRTLGEELDSPDSRTQAVNPVLQMEPAPVPIRDGE